MTKAKIIPIPQSLFADLALEAELLASPEFAPTPDAEKPRPAKPSRRVTKVKKSLAPHSLSLAGQAFLPGLSRRGRPRLKVPISAADRTAEHRRKRLEAGAKRVEMILDREVFLALDALAEHFNESRSEVVATLILKASARVLKR